MITYKNAEQRRLVKAITIAVLKDCRSLAQNNRILDIYNYLMTNPDFENVDGSALGKFNEVLLDRFPNLLHYMNEIPNTFFYGSDIKEITIPTNIKHLGQYIFYETPLWHIKYEGTETEWYDLLRHSSNNTFMGKPATQLVVDCSDKENIYGTELPENLDESMKASEKTFKDNVLEYLKEEGFPTFAKYLKNFEFNFATSDDFGDRDFVAAVVPATGTVLVNPYVDKAAISMLLRHEAGHVIFKHNEHMIAKLKKMGINSPSELARHLSNIAGDYHISNTLYDDDDKRVAKNIIITEPNRDLKELAGLVTELDFPEHPEYADMDFDQLWDVFVKDYDPKTLNQEAIEYSDDFVSGYNQAIDDFNSGKLTLDDIKDYLRELRGDN